MSDSLEINEEETRDRVLNNTQVLAYLGRQWRRRPWLLAGMIGFMSLATLTELLIPLAAGRLIDTLAAGPQDDAH